MNNNFSDIVQEGFRTIIGATASTLETIQDSEKRGKIVSELATEWEKKSQEWKEKGAMTEEEARKMIEKIFQGQKNYNPDDEEREKVEVNNSGNQLQDIAVLTQEIISLREELEKIAKK